MRLAFRLFDPKPLHRVRRRTVLWAASLKTGGLLLHLPWKISMTQGSRNEPILKYRTCPIWKRFGASVRR